MERQILIALIAVSLFSVSVAYADNIHVDTALGSGAPGCEFTAEGCYYPNTVHASLGDTVSFKNTDVSAHTFTSGDPDVSHPHRGLFDSSLVMAGGSFEWVVTETGEVPYFCMVHPWMKGLVIVDGSANNESSTDTNTSTIPQEDNSDSIALQRQINELQTENSDLKQRIISLEDEVDSLKDQIVALSGEFLENVRLLHEWFRQNLS